MADASDDLDQALRRSDPDRWLSSRFIADPAKRADVVAIYAFDHELNHIAATVTEPLAAEIRLTWWREAVEALFAGKSAPGHPVLAALATAIPRRGLAFAPFEAMIEARFHDLDADRFETAAALENHIDATDGAVMALSVAILGGLDAFALRPAAQAWGLARFARGGRERTPEGFDVAAAARTALGDAGRVVAALPVEAFPVVAHLALVRPYLAGRNPLGLEKRVRMTSAALRGRI